MYVSCNVTSTLALLYLLTYHWVLIFGEIIEELFLIVQINANNFLQV